MQKVWLMFTSRRQKMQFNSILLTFLVCLGLASCKSRPEYGIAFDTQEVNVGTVYLTSPIKEYSIEYSNIGSHELVISDIRTDCDCTTAKASDTRLASGEKGNITITLNLSNFFPQDFEKKVAVYTNVSKTPYFIELTGNIKRKE